MSYTDLRFHRPSCPLWLIVAATALISITFYPSCTSGYLCHSYRLSNYHENNLTLTNRCIKLKHIAPIDCGDGKECQKGYEITYKNNFALAWSECIKPCRQNPVTFCEKIYDDSKNTLEKLRCSHCCKDDDCGMKFFFKESHFQFYRLLFHGTRFLDPYPLYPKWYGNDTNMLKVLEIIEPKVQEIPDLNGCAIGVRREPDEMANVKVIVYLMLNAKDTSSTMRDHMATTWCPDLMKFKNVIGEFPYLADYYEPISLMSYDPAIRCPPKDGQGDFANLIKWPSVEAVGQDIHVKCWTIDFFIVHMYAVRKCHKNTSWSQIVDKSRCGTQYGDPYIRKDRQKCHFSAAHVWPPEYGAGDVNDTRHNYTALPGTDDSSSSGFGSDIHWVLVLCGGLVLLCAVVLGTLLCLRRRAKNKQGGDEAGGTGEQEEQKPESGQEGQGEDEEEIEYASETETEESESDIAD